MKAKGPKEKARNGKKLLLPLLCLCALSASPLNAALSISVEADKTEMEITDSLYLTVTVSGDSSSVPEPELPKMDNFNIYSSGRSQSISFVNGSVTSRVAFTYILSPRFIGKLKIPPISITDGSEKRYTQEIEVAVVKSAAQSQAGGTQPARPQNAAGSQGGAAARHAAAKDGSLFMTAETDKRTASVNEQINLAIRFFTAIPLTSNPQYIPPQFKNLLAEDLPPVRNGEVVIKGTRYNYSEIRAALFGLEEGQASVNPASVLVQVYRENGVDPFDPNFFQQFFAMSAGQGETRRIASPAVAIKILPLPGGAPDSFKGAVGNFTLSSELSSKAVKAGEAVNLSIAIAGKGNLKTVTAPKLPDMPDFKVYDTMSSLDISKSDDVIGGKKTFTTILIPKTAGKLTVPRIKFAFFDPAAKAYRELSAGPFELTAEKGDGGGKTFSFSREGQNTGITPLGSDIRYVTDRNKQPVSVALAERAAALPPWLNLFPAGLLLLCLWLSRLNDFRARNPLLFRFRKAHSEARTGIAAAEEKLNGAQPGEAASILYDSLLDYLHDKSGHKVSGLTMKRTLALLQEKFPGAGEFAMGEIKDLWEKLEALHFSPGGAQHEEVKEMLNKYSALLPLLEKDFSEKKR
jgi:hypothetical protein